MKALPGRQRTRKTGESLRLKPLTLKLQAKVLRETLVAADSLEVLETFEELSDGLDPEAPLSLVVRRNEGGGK